MNYNAMVARNQSKELEKEISRIRIKLRLRYGWHIFGFTCQHGTKEMLHFFTRIPRKLLDKKEIFAQHDINFEMLIFEKTCCQPNHTS